MEGISNELKNKHTPIFKTYLSQSSPIKLHEFYINNNQQNKEKYKKSNNYIRTTKYNLFTFLPKSFLIQFARLPNIYFLASAIIQSIPIISPLTSITAIVPLIFVLMVSMVRELIEDLERYRYDKLNNKEKVIVYRNNHFEESTSDSLIVGEFIIVNDNKSIPADAILLDSNLLEGICYVETSSLDGEKALKEKIANKIPSTYFKSRLSDNLLSPNDLTELDIEGTCQCDYPNADLHKLDGKITMVINNQEQSFPIGLPQMLLKGSIIKHTGWVIGMIIYTGMDNKIILNSKNPRIKISMIEKRMNRYLIFVFIFQMIICAACAITHYSEYNSNISFYKTFIMLDLDPKLESFITFFTYLLLFNTLIPISLIVTMEIVKIIQGFFINWDCELYSKIQKKFCKASSVSLNEELGNVNYIFSDKTGTLTCNKMEFKYCVIGDTCYMFEEKGNELYNQLTPCFNIRNRKSSDMLNLKESIVPFGKKYFMNLLNKQSTIVGTGNNNKVIHEFWQALSCAHECVCSAKPDGTIEYSGVSPDDIELVKTASEQGYSYLKSPSDVRKIKIGSQEKELTILKILNFSSDRRRMSIILKDGPIIKMYIKGADCEIKHRLSPQSHNSYNETASKYVDLFSSKGYRTLMVGYKTLNEEEYNNWNHKLRDGEMNLMKKQRLIDSYYDEMEKDFYLLGATMVEDKLQDHVPETIQDLRLAGIKIWVLTGDKIDTAENIALSCNLITKTQKNFKICSEKGEDKKYEKDTIPPELVTFLEEFQAFGNINYTCLDSNVSSSEDDIFYQKLINNPFNILIEGPVLTHIFKHSESKLQFLKIAMIASSVICCRVSPLQKSLVVKTVKNNDKKSITLAIGDGGNDVSMIMEAHIGIGIYGEEGLRAVQASDFAIGEFSILRRLLFFHGRTNSNRISQMILYFFYKNFFFTIIHFFFAFFCLSSGQTIIDDWFITGYNLIFTALPLGVQACSDFDVIESDGELIREMMPFLYRESRDNPMFSFLSFFLHLIKGLLLGLFNFYIVISASWEAGIDRSGNQSNLWYNSVLLYTNIIISVSITLILNQRYHIILVPIVMGISTFVLYFSFIFYVHFDSTFNSFGTMIISFQSHNFFTCLFFVAVSCYIVDYAIESQRFFGKDNFRTKLMLLTHNKELTKALLPTIILNAKKDFKLIETFNNYNLISNQSLSFSNNLLFRKKDDLFRLNMKSRSEKKLVKITSDVQLKIIDKPYKKNFSYKVKQIFSRKNSNKDSSYVSNTKPNIDLSQSQVISSSLPNNDNDNNKQNIGNNSIYAKIHPLVMKNLQDP